MLSSRRSRDAPARRFRAPQAQGTAFYPPLPNPPRIQHLKTLDGRARRRAPASGLAKFVLGDDAKAQQLNNLYGVGIFPGKTLRRRQPQRRARRIRFGEATLRVMTGAPNGRMNARQHPHRPATAQSTSPTPAAIGPGVRPGRPFRRGLRRRRPVQAGGHAIRGERLYVVDTSDHQVHALEKRTGNYLSRRQRRSKVGELYPPDQHRDRGRRRNV